MFKFFTCWADTDPIYQSYFSECNILISLANIPKSWNIDRFPIQPTKLMVDSGAFSFMSSSKGLPNQSQVFDLQLSVSRGSTVPTVLCSLDYPIPPASVETIEVYRRIETTLANAYEFMHLFKSAKLPSNFKSMGIIQGNSFDTITFCAKEMLRLGFDRLGVGSLAAILKTEPIIERVKAAIKVVGSDVHIFGISGLESSKRLMEMGISSFDSSRPMKFAMYNCLLYSNPFRQYKLKNSNVQKSMAALDSPIPCDCPICKKDPALIFNAGGKRNNNMRAVHNYYHLNKELESIYKSFNR